MGRVMEPEFWHERWAANRIAFHQGEANRMLVAHFDSLNLQAGDRVFVPLCGKTLDIAWLLEKGMRVAGAELSELAVQQLFDEMGVVPAVSDHGPLKHYQAEGADIFVGDVFDLTAEALGRVDALYDRAALVALPPDMRPGYARHMGQVSSRAQQLLITFEYDQSVMDGPPFAVTAAEVGTYYRDQYAVALLEAKEVEGGLKGIAEATAKVWHLTP